MSVRVRFESNLPQVLAATEAAKRRAVADIGNVWQGMATLLTPVDSGVLRASLAWAALGEQRAHSRPYAGNDKVPPGVVEYDPTAPESTLRLGSNTEYALYVHEDLDAFHKVGQAKFIEFPLRQNKDKWVVYIVTKMGEVLE